MKVKGLIKKVLLLALALIICFSAVITVNGLGWSGEGVSGGHVSSGESGAYAVTGVDASQSIVGYRFAGRTGSGRDDC